jgi:hypothetical protein
MAEALKDILEAHIVEIEEIEAHAQDYQSYRFSGTNSRKL